MTAGELSAPAVVVTGATGAVGRHVARALARRGPVRSLVRDPGKAEALGIGGEIVVGDYRDGAGLERAFTGAGAVFVVTADPLRPQDDAHILDAARAAGVRRAVKLSWLAVADPRANDLVARWNRESERLLRSSGLAWTVLRMRTPMSNTLSWAASIRRESVVRALGGDARTACVDPRDVAEAAVRALTEPEHAGRTYALTGPELLSARAQTATLARVLGRPVGFEELTPEQALARWSARLPRPVAQALLEAAQRRQAGESAEVEGDLGGLLRRPPTTFAVWAADHASAFG
ncbi:NAD(P)H-binding protein [Streptomyces sp. NPDC047706]|uniref:NAD(P)H-binding protein n=1 Tax=Streptomyces sp. NPDC047706 TaxID=3365486 RepID=UPI00371B0692